MDNKEAFEPGKIYYVDHNGIPSFGYLRTTEDGDTIAYDLDRVWNLSQWTADASKDGVTFTRGDSQYTIRPVQLGDATVVFPDLIRTFLSTDSLEAFARKEIALSDSYTPNTLPDELVSFTVDDGKDGKVLELIRETLEGQLYVRENHNWVRLTDGDHPTIMDKDLVRVEAEDIPTAIKVWDKASEQGADLTRNDILTMAASQQ